MVGSNFKKQSPACIPILGRATQTALHREACTELPGRTAFLPSAPALIKEFLKSYLTNKTEAFSVHQSCPAVVPVNIFTNQSEQLHSDQSRKCLFNQSTACIWSPQTNQGPEAGTSVHEDTFPLALQPAFPFHPRQKTAFPQLC